MVAGLGAAWILDGPQITISSSVTGVLIVGYLIGGAIMALGGIIELAFGIKAGGKYLETVTKPLTATAG